MAVIKHKNQRVGIFIDTQNLYHSAKNLYSSKVNFGKVVEDALAGRSLIRAVAYVITTESGDEQSFFEALGKVGITTKTKDLQIFSGGAKKADWDVGMAVDAISLSPKLDAVVLVTGDGDLLNTSKLPRDARWKSFHLVNQLQQSSLRLLTTSWISTKILACICSTDHIIQRGDKIKIQKGGTLRVPPFFPSTKNPHKTYGLKFLRCFKRFLRSRPELMGRSRFCCQGGYLHLRLSLVRE